ncbi:GH39 family glycosyl hydrolase [Actinomycetospora cinnamomea]|uniref:Glycosyl hydrolase family 39 n=1 Tax=Actinomycetospora cinnamomea TaxID=663609 RepID=A0A2U1EXF8_9PSEU|nr:xylan 1,4-beta-xylosidase [Actinomycetospora cinnamomea]PVZ04596.1 glycosyl hydrolase family 39 [Actinomycetospora cinnamomea]
MKTSSTTPLLLVLVLVLVGCASAAGSDEQNELGWGMTHTQWGIDQRTPEAIASMTAQLTARPMVQAQSIMGWGVGNPEPAPGEFDFASLDGRMSFIRRSGGIPVITLCCAPDWMKGGEEGETDWSRLEVAPSPEHYQDFADLAAEVARRYPDVRHFMVWNEFKGFFNESTNTWDGEAYTELYNAVYDAVKQVNPANQIGGPYLDMAAPPPGLSLSPSSLAGSWGQVDPRTLNAFDTWAREKRGADFVVVDGIATVEEGAPDRVTALAKLSAVSEWVRQRVDLPLWWAEWYVEPRGAGWSPATRTAMNTAALVQFVRSDVATALFWNSAPSASSPTDLWTADGQPLPFLAVLQSFNEWFPPGTPLQELGTAPPLFTLASPRMVVLVNVGDQSATATVDGTTVTLAPDEVRWVARDTS